MFDEFHDDNLSFDTKNHFVSLDIRITQAHATCVDERPWDDLNSRFLAGLVMDGEAHTTGSALTDEFVEPPMADVFGIIVMTFLLPL